MKLFLKTLFEKTTNHFYRLMLAARAGSVRLVEMCLGAGYDVTLANVSDKQTALHAAASSGGDRKEIGRLLVEAGSDVSIIHLSTLLFCLKYGLIEIFFTFLVRF